MNDTYRMAIVTYLDILGFSRLIDETRSDPSRTAKIAEALSNVKEKTSAGGRIHRNDGGEKQKIFYSFNFSDLTVRCTIVPAGVDLGEYLNWELLYVSNIQLSLLREGVPIRGGISIGEI